MSAFSPELRAHIERLGGVIGEVPASAPTEIRGHATPPLLRALSWGVRWPESAEYRNDEDADLHLWMFRWQRLQWLEEADFEVADRNERPLCCVGISDGGNYLLCVRLDDRDPNDPEITRIDHHDPEQRYDDSASMRLSELLASLETDTR